MGKRKWRRVRRADLADTEKQKEIMGLIDRANRPGQEPPQRPPEAAQAER